MLKRLQHRMNENYFGKHFPLDYRVYMIFFFESYFISILSAITNTLLNKGIFGIVLQWTYIVFCSFLLFLLPRRRLIIQKPHLLFITFMYIPFLFFQTAGYHGTALLFAQLGIFLIGIVFSGNERIIIISLNILEYLVCILINYKFPQTVIDHSGPGAQLIDLIVALILSFSGLAALTVFISMVFSDNNKALEELSIRDALTGTYNRRYLNDFLSRQLEADSSAYANLYVMMLDIDHFKRINDSHGHGFGDRVLLECAQTIRDNLRDYDVVVRYGGEEFVIIAFLNNDSIALEFAERIRKKISSLHFRYDLSITVSIGLSPFKPGDTVESILERADQCLYKAKQSGRNRVVCSM